MSWRDSETFEHLGRRFRFKLEHDDYGGMPWKRDDGHGPVTDWTTADKAPGQMLLARDGSLFRLYYDFAEATRIAKAEGWGLADQDLAALAEKLGRQPTRKQIVREAVLQDFDRLRRWCQDEWCYVGVVVQELDEDGRPLPGEASLWGIESDSREYHREVAEELAEEVAAHNGDLLRA